MDIVKIRNNLKKEIAKARTGDGLKDYSNKELEDVAKLKKKLHQSFQVEQENVQRDEVIRESQFRPITEALKHVESAVRESSKKEEKALLPFKMITSSSNLNTSTSNLKLPTPVKQIAERSKVTTLGQIASYYLPKVKDSTFGIYHDSKTNKYMIGKEPIEIVGNDIIINNEIIKGTQGIWRLLTYAEYLPMIDRYYDSNDLDIYKRILISTESIFHNNDRATNRVKSSRSEKYMKIVSKVWSEYKEGRGLKKTGRGLKKYSDSPIEYKYITNFDELLKRLSFINSEEKAGNNNFHNEKIGVLHFILREIEHELDKPNGTELLITLLNNLPKRGSGLVNDILNSKFLPELHFPGGYNYLGPFTKLDNKLKNNIEPKNKLDAAAREHDIFYHKHKDTESRHKADHKLEHEAWEIYKDPNTPIPEKVASYITTNVMKVKRSLGMGLI